ncbi:MAG: hypothetical protein GC187_05025 [Alphaproteobacteria bacterium]|nr:hypothetical protein [Alphaproteobacteria bacterium]
MIRVCTAGLALLLMGAAPGAFAQDAGAYDAGTVQITNFIGRIEIREGGDQVVVEARPGADGADTAQVSLTGGVVVIDGGQTVSGVNCRRRDGEAFLGGGRSWFGFGGGDSRAISEYPSLVITAPASLGLVIRDSIYEGEAGALGEANLAVRSCTHFTTGQIAGALNAAMSGSGALTAGDVGGAANFALSGSGRITTGDIAGAVDARISGAGDVRTGDIAGALTAVVSGSGGLATGDAGDLTSVVSGAGSVRVEDQTGAMSARISGSGSVRAASGRAQPFSAIVSGAGSVRHGGEAVDVDVAISGSGSVQAGQYSGELRWRGRGAPAATASD